MIATSPLLGVTHRLTVTCPHGTLGGGGTKAFVINRPPCLCDRVRLAGAICRLMRCRA